MWPYHMCQLRNFNEYNYLITLPDVSCTCAVLAEVPDFLIIGVVHPLPHVLRDFEEGYSGSFGESGSTGLPNEVTSAVVALVVIHAGASNTSLILIL